MVGTSPLGLQLRQRPSPWTVLVGLSIQPPPMTKIREDDRATKAKMAWTTTTTTTTKVATMMLIIIITTTIIPRIKDQTVTTEARRGERRLPCKILFLLFLNVCVLCENIL